MFRSESLRSSLCLRNLNEGALKLREDEHLQGQSWSLKATSRQRFGGTLSDTRERGSAESVESLFARLIVDSRFTIRIHGGRRAPNLNLNDSFGPSLDSLS